VRGGYSELDDLAGLGVLDAVELALDASRESVR